MSPEPTVERSLSERLHEAHVGCTAICFNDPSNLSGHDDDIAALPAVGLALVEVGSEPEPGPCGHCSHPDWDHGEVGSEPLTIHDGGDSEPPHVAAHGIGSEPLTDNGAETVSVNAGYLKVLQDAYTAFPLAEPLTCAYCHAPLVYNATDPVMHIGCSIADEGATEAAQLAALRAVAEAAAEVTWLFTDNVAPARPDIIAAVHALRTALAAAMEAGSE